MTFDDDNMKQYFFKLTNFFQDKEKVYKTMQDICAVISSIDERDIERLVNGGMSYSRVTYIQEALDRKNVKRISFNSIFNNGKKLAIVQHLKDLESGWNKEQIGIIVDENGLIQRMDYEQLGDYDIEEIFEYDQILKKAEAYKKHKESKDTKRIISKLFEKFSKEQDISVMNEEQIKKAIQELKRITDESVIEEYKRSVIYKNEDFIDITYNTLKDIQKGYEGLTAEDIASEEQTFHTNRSNINIKHKEDHTHMEDTER